MPFLVSQRLHGFVCSKEGHGFWRCRDIEPLFLIKPEEIASNEPLLEHFQISSRKGF